MTDLFVVAALCAVDLILIWTVREMEEQMEKRMDILAAAVPALREMLREAVRDADQI